MNTHVTFVTAAFEMETPKENFINPCCFGEDCADWLAGTLKEMGIDVGEVFQEDWGWCFCVRRDSYNFWIGVGLVDEEKTWLVFCESSLGLFKRLCGHSDKEAQLQLGNSINDALKATSHVSDIQWYSKENWMRGKAEWISSPN